MITIFIYFLCHFRYIKWHRKKMTLKITAISHLWIPSGSSGSSPARLHTSRKSWKKLRRSAAKRWSLATGSGVIMLIMLILTPKSCLDGSFWFNEFWQGIDPLILCLFDSRWRCVVPVIVHSIDDEFCFTNCTERI